MLKQTRVCLFWFKHIYFTTSKHLTYTHTKHYRWIGLEAAAY